MIDDDTSEYERYYPLWSNTIKALPDLGRSTNPLLRVWWYKEVKYLPAHTVLWRMARGTIPVRNFGKLGRERLRESLRAAGIPEPVDPDEKTEHRLVTMILKCSPGDAQYYGALAIMLRRDIEEIEEFSHLLISSMSYWLDILVDDLSTEDRPALLKEVKRAMGRLTPPTPPSHPTLPPTPPTPTVTP